MYENELSIFFRKTFSIHYISNDMKKISLFLLFAACTLSGTAQRYTVTGKASSGAKTAYLFNVSGDKADSMAVAADGAFKFDGDAKGEVFALVHDDKGKRMEVVLDGAVNVDLGAQTVGGTPENAKLNNYTKEMVPVLESVMEAVTYLKSHPEEKSATAEAKEKVYEESMRKIGDITKRAVTENLTARFPAILVAQYGSLMEESELAALAALNPASFKENVLQPILQQVEAAKRRMPGLPYTDLKMADPNGIVKSLSDYCGKGNYVLVDFWASWCGPCRAEMPAVKALYEKYKGKGFDIVGVSFDRDKNAWTAAIKKLDLPWHHISDLKGWQCEAASVYGISGIPATLLIDPNGKIVAFGLRGADLEAKLKEIYGE